jgi:hypothetical protein
LAQAQMPKTNFSTKLVQDPVFIGMVEISTLSSAWSWFEKLLSLNLEEEKGFDALCLFINDNILASYIEIVKDRLVKNQARKERVEAKKNATALANQVKKEASTEVSTTLEDQAKKRANTEVPTTPNDQGPPSKKIKKKRKSPTEPKEIPMTFNQKILELARSSTVTTFAKDNSNLTSWTTQKGLCVLVQTLGRLFVSSLRQGVRSRVQTLRGANVKVAAPHIRDVNKLVGWAIFSLRSECSAQIADARDENALRWAEIELDLLTETRMFEAEAMLDDEYMENCYDPDLQIVNQGFLTLVAPGYFEFGRALLGSVASSVNQERFAQQGVNMAKIAKNSLSTQKGLLNMFLECASSFEFLPRDRKIKLYERLVEKIVNVKVNDEMKYYKDRKTGRQAEGRSDTTHRGALKAKVEGTVVLPQNRVKSD